MSKEKLSADVRMHQGRPTLFLNGEIATPILYSLTSIPGGRWSWEEIPHWNIRRFGDAGIHLHQVDLNLHDAWMEDGSITLDTALRQLRGVLSADPEAAIMIRFHVNAPAWWERRHPDECTAYADVPARWPIANTAFHSILGDNLGPLKLHSLASALWREEASAAYAEFLRLLGDTPEGGRVFSFQVADGVYGEWHPFGFLSHDPDVSAPMTRAFRAFLREKYADVGALRAAWGDPDADFSTASLPGTNERERTFDGIFRAIGREQRVIDCYECLHDVVSGDIVHFCAVTKAAWPRPVVTAAFYGYFYSLFGRQAAGGHLGIARVLNSPDVDCLCAPQTYLTEHRAMGGSGQSRLLLESARLHGKLTLDEMDQPPYDDRMHPVDRDLANKTLDESIAILRRNVFASISRGMGMWYYDFGPRDSAGWWMRPALMAEIERLQVLFTERCERPYEPQADVLVVYDEKSFLYTANNQRADPVTDHIALNQVATALYQSGACFDTVYLADLPLVDLARYRCVVLANTYRMSAEQCALIHERVARAGRHLVYFYAPNAASQDGACAEAIGRLTGIRVRRADIANPLSLSLDAQLGGGELNLCRRYTDLYFMFPDLDAGLLRRFSPAFSVEDADAQALGWYGGTDETAVARKRCADHTSWYASVPLAHPDALRAIFRDAGAHIYSDAGDSLLIGSGLIMVHTRRGGPREIALRNGQTIHALLPACSSTFYDATTGDQI